MEKLRPLYLRGRGPSSWQARVAAIAHVWLLEREAPETWTPHPHMPSYSNYEQQPYVLVIIWAAYLRQESSAFRFLSVWCDEEPKMTGRCYNYI